MVDILDSIRVCEDCYLCIGSGDDSSIIFYSGSVRAAEVWAAIKSLKGYAVPNNSEGFFSNSPCQCCWCEVAGNRYEVTILSE